MNDDKERETLKVMSKQEEIGNNKSEPRCLLCPSSVFSNRQSLSRHVWKSHEFNIPFCCPECQRIGAGDVVVAASREAWSGHVARCLSRLDVPNPNSAKTAYCPFCTKSFTTRGFSAHLYKHYKEMKKPFLCPECHRQGQSCEVVGGGDAWMLHVRRSHAGSWEVPGAVVASTEGPGGEKVQANAKRERDRVDGPYKQVRNWSEDKVQESCFERDYKVGSAQEHDGEEFYVTGRDWDYA